MYLMAQQLRYYCNFYAMLFISSDKVCDVNSPYLSQVGHVCAACYVDYNWSYRLLWLQCCKPDEHVNAGKVAAVYYSAEGESSSLWRVRPLPKVQLLLNSTSFAMKRCVTKNCGKGRRCAGAHSNVEMIYWGFQEGLYGVYSCMCVWYVCM